MHWIWYCDNSNIQLKAQNRLGKVTYIVYWYDATDLNQAYSFISPSQIIFEAEMMKHRLHQLPAWVQRKLDNQMNLTELDQDVIRGYQEMQADLKLERSQQRRGVLEYKENYDMLSLGDLKELDLDELFDHDDDVDNVYR